MEEYNHSGDDADTRIVGVYSSKEAAVASAGSVESRDWGNLVETARQYDEGDLQDYRDNPPDDGVLLQLFGEDIGEGDYARILIKRYPVLGLKKQKKGKGGMAGSKDGSVVDLCDSS